MHSFSLQPLVVSPSRADIHNPKTVSHYPSPPGNNFSNPLLSIRICTENPNPETGYCYHAQILKSGLQTDVFIGNSLLNMYSKYRQLQDARNVFDYMPHRTIVSWNSMMSAYHHHGLSDEAIQLFFRMLEHHLQPSKFTLAVLLQACASIGDRNLVVAIQCYAIKTRLITDSFLENCLIDAFAKSGMYTTAEKLMRRLCKRDVVSWTSVISSCVRHGNGKKALALFCHMQEDGVLPNDVTLLTVLHACSDINTVKTMQWVHGLILKGNWCTNGLVLNSLIEMYSTNGYFFESMKIFRLFCLDNNGCYPSPETMANVLQGCGNCGTLKIGEQIHGYLIKHDFLSCTVVGNSLINMYSKNGYKDSAFLLFRKMFKIDIVSWNTIINCFLKNGYPFGALTLLGEIHRGSSREKNISPDFVTVLTSLEACTDLALLTQGQVVHGYLARTGLLGDIFVRNALIDMYAKSGRLDFAAKVFDEMRERDIGSWNSIIAAYGINGDGVSALKLFFDLVKIETVKPNAITFVNILSTCAHAGLVEQGLEIFNSMEKNHDVRSRMEHYSCMVDLLGRAGRVEQAEAFIRKMSIRAGPDVWGALLSASVVAGNLSLAEKAAKELSVLEPQSSAWRVSLSNAYAAAGEWRKVAEIRAGLREMNVRKEGGWSSVNVGGFEFSFMAGDTKCLENPIICDVIARLRIHMRDCTTIVLT